MFGLGRRKCRECGAVLEDMERGGARSDDLLKNSAINGPQGEQEVCAACRTKAYRRAIVPNAVPAEVTQRTVAHATSGQTSSESSAYQAGGGFKTESELFAEQEDQKILASMPDNLSPLMWLITTKIGRNVGLILFFAIIFGFRSCSEREVQQEAMAPPTTDLPKNPENGVGDVMPTPTLPPPPAPVIPTAPARPANNPGSWATTADYPSRALNEQREGTAGFLLTINPQGAVTECVITQSSGHADLDKATCAAISKRARFERAPGGTANRGYRNRVTWRIPD
jgi:TonB family protein